MHARGHLRLIFDQASADMQDVMLENCHGNMLGSAGALG